jgi:hypothetical protein
VASYDPKIDYYELLQVHPQASTPVIKAAFRAILKELRAHPDLGGRTDLARLLNDARRVLGDPDLRRAYDGERLVVAAGPADELALEQVVICDSCGMRSSLSLGTDTRSTDCPHCRAPLREMGPEQSAAPAEQKENVFDLPADQFGLLRRNSQIDLRLGHVAAGETLRCRFCGNDWTARKSGKPTMACPMCSREDWHASRVLKCRVCGCEWRSGRLSRWAYRDHPRCPNCANARWSSYCESHPLRWLLAILSR